MYCASTTEPYHTITNHNSLYHTTNPTQFWSQSEPCNLLQLWKDSLGPSGLSNRYYYGLHFKLTTTLPSLLTGCVMPVLFDTEGYPVACLFQLSFHPSLFCFLFHHTEVAGRVAYVRASVLRTNINRSPTNAQFISLNSSCQPWLNKDRK